MLCVEFVPAPVTASEQELQWQFLALQHAFPGMIWDGDMAVQSECEERNHALKRHRRVCLWKSSVLHSSNGDLWALLMHSMQDQMQFLYKIISLCLYLWLLRNQWWSCNILSDASWVTDKCATQGYHEGFCQEPDMHTASALNLYRCFERTRLMALIILSQIKWDLQRKKRNALY